MKSKRETFTDEELRRLSSLGWVFTQTGPEEWEWLLCEGDVVVARQGSDMWRRAVGRVEEPEPVVVLAQRWPPHREEWKTLTEVRSEPFWPEGPHGEDTGPPVVVVEQHQGTREIRVNVYDCDGGLDVTFTNAGVTTEAKKLNQRWFRDLRTCRDGLRRLTIRLMARGSGDNLELKS